MSKFLLTENDLRGLIRKLLFEIQDTLNTDFYADYGEFSGVGTNLNDNVKEIIKDNNDFFENNKINFSKGTNEKPSPRIVLDGDNLVVAVDGNPDFSIAPSKKIKGIKIHHSKKDNYTKMEFKPSIDNIEKILLDSDNKTITQFNKATLLKDESNILYCLNIMISLHEFISRKRNSIKIKDNQTKRKESEFIDEILECLKGLTKDLLLAYENKQDEDDK